jgi:general secretion pathway protein J
MSQPTHARGFTLFEIVVVMFIFSILSVLAFGGLTRLNTQREAIDRAFDRNAEYQKAYLRLRNDIQNLRARPIRDAYGDSQPAFLGSLEAGLEFTRGGWRNPLNTQRSSFERVAYRLVDDRLLRVNWRVLDRAQDSAPTELTLLQGVDEIAWRFLDYQLEWVEAWPDPLSDRSELAESPPPLAIELTLVTRDLGQMRLLFKPGYEANAGNDLIQNPDTPAGIGPDGDGDAEGPEPPDEEPSL